MSQRKSNGGGPGSGRAPKQRPGIIRPPGVWVLTVGRLVVLYIAATFFGANVALALDAWEAGESAIGPIIGAIAMSVLSLYVLTRSYRHRPASGQEPGSESPDRG